MAFEPFYNTRGAAKKNSQHYKDWVQGGLKLIGLATDIYINSKDSWSGTSVEDAAKLDLAQKSCVAAIAIINRALTVATQEGRVTSYAAEQYLRACDICEQVSDIMDDLEDRVIKTDDESMQHVETKPPTDDEE